MPANARYLFIASMDVDPAKEALFNEVYDTEHIPNLLKMPGVLSVKRYTTEPLTLSIGGEKKKVVSEGEPRYSAVYELESPEVLVSAAWEKAVEAGRWPAEVRPYTRNRRHVVHKLMGTFLEVKPPVQLAASIRALSAVDAGRAPIRRMDAGPRESRRGDLPQGYYGSTT
jgi:hypothetical protein